MRYILLLRGINVGGKNKVAMSELKALLEGLNFQNVHSYINSGNFFFNSSLRKEELLVILERFLDKNYPFIKVFSLFTLEDYQNDLASLPKWWSEDFYRKDVLFFTERLD